MCRNSNLTIDSAHRVKEENNKLFGKLIYFQRNVFFRFTRQSVLANAGNQSDAAIFQFFPFSFVL